MQFVNFSAKLLIYSRMAVIRITTVKMIFIEIFVCETIIGEIFISYILIIRVASKLYGVSATTIIFVFVLYCNNSYNYKSKTYN